MGEPRAKDETRLGGRCFRKVAVCIPARLCQMRCGHGHRGAEWDVRMCAGPWPSRGQVRII